jgi:hypothetical protein
MAKKTQTAAVVVAPVKKGWRVKLYYINLDVYNVNKESLAKQPNQVQIMVNHFATKFVTKESASRGLVMCQSAIDEGSLKTRIDPAVLFAYYRSTMEQFGLTLAN